jgi:hypothetical protein
MALCRQMSSTSTSRIREHCARRSPGALAAIAGGFRSANPGSRRRQGLGSAPDRKGKHLDRRIQVERELSLLATKMDRLMDALADGAAPKDEIIARLNEEKQRKTVLAAELTKLSELAGIESLDETGTTRACGRCKGAPAAEHDPGSPDAVEATRWVQDRDGGIWRGPRARLQVPG